MIAGIWSANAFVVARGVFDEDCGDFGAGSLVGLQTWALARSSIPDDLDDPDAKFIGAKLENDRSSGHRGIWAKLESDRSSGQNLSEIATSLNG